LSVGLDGSKILLHCHAGCRTEEIVKALGLTMGDLRVGPTSEKRQVVATYDYVDEEGELLFQVVRKKPKTFYQRRLDGNGGWINNLHGVRRVLYRLPGLLAADKDATVYVVEGERDADRLALLGLVATTNPGGAGKWKEEFSEFLRDRQVTIIPDNDPPGKQHAEQVFESLQSIARSVRVLDLPGLPPKGDVSDWLDQGHTPEELRVLVAAPGGSIEDARKTVAKWLELPDLDVVDLMLATVVANAYPGDPVWLLLVGAPSSAKSELLRGLGDAAQICRISSLTGKTLLSGHKDAKGGLLFRIAGASTLLLLDFGQVLSLHPNDKALVLQRLREVYDGYTKGDFGNRADGIEWRGKLGFLAGVTPAIEKYTSVGAELGDRFLQYALDVPDPKAQAKSAMVRAGQETTMREEIARALLRALGAAGDSAKVSVSEEILDLLSTFAVFTTRLRSPVSRNRYTRVIDYLPKPEGPARFGKALICLGKALAAARGKESITEDELRVLAKVALDCIPSRRKAVVGALNTLGEGKTKKIGLEANIASISTGDILEDLMYLGAADRWTESDADNAPFKWRLKTDVARQWSLVNDIASSRKAPLKKQTGGLGGLIKGEQKDDTAHSLVFQEEPRNESLMAKTVYASSSPEPHPSAPSEDALSIAATRTEAHRHSTSTRPLSEGYDIVGAAGELAFAKEFGVKVDTMSRPEGDHGIDFQTPAGTVDVKTYRKPHHLLREVGKPHADILVLAGFDDATGEAELIGWEWDAELQKCPTKDFGYGILNHYKPADELRPISELHELIACEEPVPF